MQVYHSVAEVAAASIRHPVVTVGVFDGVHVGHRHVLHEVTRLATAVRGESVVVTFRTHPRAIIAGEMPRLITSINHRLRLFEELGIDHCLTLTFDETMRAMRAAEFAHSVLEEAIGAQVVVLGHNHAFGKDREGTADFLLAHRDDFSFEARKALEVRFGDQHVSSSDIRQAIVEGDLDRASSMLGRPYAVYGTVVHGEARGRTIGFPTANLDLHEELKPPFGVYGCRVHLESGDKYSALVNIGIRPTFEGTRELLEAHLLDFDDDLYDQSLEIVFLTRLRGEKRFDGPDALVAQIEADRAAFRAWLDNPGAAPQNPV